MRRVTAFVLLVAPALAWLPVRFWVQEQVSLWDQAHVELPLRTRILIATDNNVVRYYSFVLLAVLLLMPLWAYLASLLERGNSFGARRALLGWTLLAAAFALAMVAASYLPTLEMLWCTGSFWWASTVCYAFALGAAYVVQKDRASVGSNRWRPYTVLCLGGVAPMFAGPAAALFPALVWVAARRDAREPTPQNNQMQLTRSARGEDGSRRPRS